MKVTLFGDSIRFGTVNGIGGYGRRVEEMLKDEFEIYQPDENCRFAKHTLRMLVDCKDAMEGSNIVHFNVGHWDIADPLGDGNFSTKEEYATTLKRIATVMLSRYDKVIFATTTPVRDARGVNDNATIDSYNEVAIKTLEPMGVIINDLNTLLREGRDKFICDDLTHLSVAGEIECARAVCAVIRRVAGELK